MELGLKSTILTIAVHKEMVCRDHCLLPRARGCKNNPPAAIPASFRRQNTHAHQLGARRRGCMERGGHPAQFVCLLANRIL